MEINHLWNDALDLCIERKKWSIDFVLLSLFEYKKMRNT